MLWLAAAAQSPGGNAAWRPRVPLGLDLYMPVPESNPLTQKKAELGRKLFFDPILSRDLSLSCAGCHQPEHAFTDARRVAVGVFGRTGTRNAPTLVNRAWGRAHFWDGREAALESTVLKPIQNPDELDMMLEEAVARLRAHAEYPLLFQQAFGREPAAEDLAHALASFVRSILSGDAPVDRYMNGDRAALTEEQLLGLRIFRGKGNCVACHVGPNFTDEQFHNTGV
ncbi:MAG TPA: cytochrome-c peroxidase, partial [Candidatus Acidoferrales bacterium]